MKRLTRRQFLLGGTGMIGALAAGGAYEATRHPTIAHRLGMEKSPDYSPPKSNTNLYSGTLDSRHMGRKIGWTYSMPSENPTATVFCLHGKSGTHSAVFDGLKLHDMVATQHLPLAVAAVDGGDGYWHKRKDGTDAQAMLMDEFIPLIESRTGTKEKAIYGWSMGGYGALLAAETFQVFAAVVAMSPALWTSSSQTAPGAFDDAADFAAHDVFAGRDRLESDRVRISCGTSDLFYDSTRKFVSGISRAQVNFGPGFHDDSYWRSVSPAALDFISSRVASLDH